MNKRLEVQRSCQRFLSGHPRLNARARLEQLAASPFADTFPDAYGEGDLVQELEKEMAEMLGKEATVFVIKGVIAQLAALRVWTDRTGTPTVALHPKSHIDFDENAAYERLHNLRGIRLGEHNPISYKNLTSVKERIGVVVIELPLRQAGYKLPEWKELEEISSWCRENQIPLHFDGARMWEITPYYERSLAEISALADSVYLSFYKGLGGLAGCVLAGSADFIREADLWKARHGGNLYTAFPYVISAKIGLAERLPKMGEYYKRAVELASELSEIAGVSIAPNPPQCNAFQIYLPADKSKLEEVSLEIAKETSVWLFGGFAETALPGLTMAEISVGDVTAALSNAEVVELIQLLIERAK